MGNAWDRLWLNAHLATMQPGAGPYGAIYDGAIASRNGRIVFVGTRSELLRRSHQVLAADVVDCGGGWITPGLIDCHTHLVFAGDRSDEFERRLAGTSYAEIERGGGGIMATVHATRMADEEELYNLAVERLRHWKREGVTTIEIKSGYGLSVQDELKILRVIRRLKAAAPIDVRATFLGAHTFPIEYRDSPERYVDLVCNDMLPHVASEKLAEFVDVFMEDVAFNHRHAARIFKMAAKFGIRAKLHADQLSESGGAEIAAKHCAVSADHLEYTSEAGVSAMAKAGTTAVLLPGACIVLGSAQKPPVEALRRHRVPIAIATDFNPGSSPLRSLMAAMNLACILYRLTPEEVLAGVTRNAAKALALDGDRGMLAIGMRADLLLWTCRHPRELSYWIGGDVLPRVWPAGTDGSLDDH